MELLLTILLWIAAICAGVVLLAITVFATAALFLILKAIVEK